MLDTDAPALFALLDDIWTLKGQALMGARQKALFFAALSPYGWPEVDAGLMAHVRDPKRGQFLPMPGDVIAQIDMERERDGRPTVEEAWAQAFKASDERATVVWCAEQAEAYGVCRPLMQAGDEVAARMAFKDAYSRLIREAREQRIPTTWHVSEGHDLEQRRRVVTAAVQLGRLRAESVEPLLLESGQRGQDGMLVLPAPDNATPNELAAREKFLVDWPALRARMLSRPDESSASEAEQLRTRALKLAQQAKVDDYTAQQGQAQ